MAVFSCLLTKLIWLFDKLIQKLFLHPYHENDTCHGNDKPNLEYLLGSALVICYHKSPKFFNILNTPQPLYNTIVGVQANFHVSYPIRVITRVKCIVR